MPKFFSHVGVAFLKQDDRLKMVNEFGRDLDKFCTHAQAYRNWFINANAIT